VPLSPLVKTFRRRCLLCTDTLCWRCDEQRASELVGELGAFFKRLALVRLGGSKAPQKTGGDRHNVHWQLDRRRHLALSRNRLLWAALSHVDHRNVKWVLWLDVDLRHVPRDLIRYLLAANQSIVVPNCLWKQDNGQVSLLPALYHFRCLTK